MGLLDRFRSGGLKWKCENCGKVHRSNPEKCKECGHTVLIQHRPSSTSPRSQSTPSSAGVSTDNSTSKKQEWYCEKCHQSHDNKRDECKVCGHDVLKPISKESTSDSTSETGVPLTATHDEDYDGPSISNVDEIDTSSNSKDARLIRLLVPITIVLVMIGILLLRLI